MKTEFYIQGMHCASCAADIRETLEETDGVSRAEVTFDGQTASVDFDEATIQPGALIKKIQDLGYQATLGDHPSRPKANQHERKD